MSESSRSLQKLTATARRRLRGTTTLVDYAISSASNFLLTIAIAHSTSGKAFGAFSLAYGTYLVALGLTRSFVAEPLLVARRPDPRVDSHGSASQAVGASVLVGLCCSLTLLAGASIASGAVKQAMLIFACALPALLVQDTLRYLAFSSQTTSRAIRSDCLWLAGQIVAFGVLIVAGADGAALLLAWVLCGVAATVIGLQLHGLAWRSLRPRLPASRHLGLRYLGEFLTSLGAGQLILLLVSLFAGLEGTGAIRGGQVILGPLVILQTAMPALVVPMCARAIMYGRSIASPCRLVGIAMVALTALWALAVLVLPNRIGALVLGDTWASARGLVIPQAVIVAFQGVSLGAMVGLRATLAASASLKLRLALAPLYVLSAGLGAAFGGTTAALWCWALATPIGSFFWWRLVRKVVASRAEVLLPSSDAVPISA